jgi:ATP-binding cassette subfamily F protein uup
MAAPVLTLQNIHLTFGVRPLLVGAEMIVEPQDRICLVGRNGSGKSTLMKVAAGLVEPDDGEVFVHPGATVRYLPQEPDFSGFETVLAYVEAGLAPGDDAYRARYLLEHLGLAPDADPAPLSGGEARRAALARTLAPDPDVLLLDEPTNHLDLPAIEWLEGELKSRRAALVLISHDRRFLEDLSRKTVWLDRGASRSLDQGFAGFEDWRDRVFEEEEAEQHKLDRKIAREEHWVRHGVSGRRKRNVRRMAELRALKDRRSAHRGPQGGVNLEADEAGASGKRVIEAREISKSYAGRAIVRPLSMRLARGDRLGLIGPNGAGKTTLLNMLIGALEPDGGEVRLGANLEIASLDQKRETLKPGWTLKDALTRGAGDQVEVNGEPRHVMSWMKDFLFEPHQANTPVEVLSGGERARVALARALSAPSNLLVLDEPTNDLDLETLDLLQELIADYPGTVLLVSHDRDFLDRTCTSVVAFEGDGTWIEYAGGYSDMVAQRGAGVTARADAARPDKPAGKAPEKPRTGRDRKMSFKDKHALETLPGEIEAIDARVSALETELADAALFTRDPDRFHAATAEHARLLEEKAAKEERWLELEMLREEIEGG